MDDSYENDQSFENRNININDNLDGLDLGKKEDDIKIKTKTRKPLTKLDAVKLIDDQKGIRELYSMVKYNTDFKTEEENYEYSNLKKLIFMYQNWHNSLIPSYKFEFFVDRLKSLSKEPRVSNTLKDLRNLHKGIIGSKDDFLNNEHAKSNQSNAEDDYLPPLNYKDSDNDEEQYNSKIVRDTKISKITNSIIDRNKEETKSEIRAANDDYNAENFYEYIEAEQLHKAKNEGDLNVPKSNESQNEVNSDDDLGNLDDIISDEEKVGTNAKPSKEHIYVSKYWN